jgi:hypothetical protein
VISQVTSHYPLNFSLKSRVRICLWVGEGPPHEARGRKRKRERLRTNGDKGRLVYTVSE